MVPETLEPSLQLASAVLSQLNMPADEVAQAIQSFRKNHVAELQVTLRVTWLLGYHLGLTPCKLSIMSSDVACTTPAGLQDAQMCEMQDGIWKSLWQCESRAYQPLFGYICSSFIAALNLSVPLLLWQEMWKPFCFAYGKQYKRVSRRSDLLVLIGLQ